MPARPDPISSKRINAFKALAHPSRLRITEALMQGELCVNEIRELIGDDVSTVSKHLSILRIAGVLHSEKRGLNVYYTLSCNCFGDLLKCIDAICPLPGASSSSASPANHCC